MTPTTSLCLIVRDASATIDRLLGSITHGDTKPADEIVVSDTGSTDDTVEKLEAWRERLAALGCELRVDRDGPLVRFDHARQRVFDRARGDWRGYFDADDYLDDGWAATYAALPSQAPDACDCIVVPYLYKEDRGDGMPDIQKRVAWLRWKPGLWRWDGYVHEVPQRQEPGPPESVVLLIAPAVRHQEQTWTPEAMARRTERNRRLLLAQAQDMTVPRHWRSRARGYLCLEALASGQIEDARAVLIPARPFPDDDDQVAKAEAALRAYEARRPVTSLAIFAVGSVQAWHARSPETTGCGGSEEAVVYLAREAAHAGLDVTVYGAARDEDTDGVKWRRNEHWEAGVTGADLVLTWRSALASRLLRPGQLAFLWMHDTDVGRCDPEDFARHDAVLTLSAFQERCLREAYPDAVLPPFRRVGNGLPDTAFGEAVLREPHRAVYVSSPDRGLPRLIDLWPRVREQIPDATLDVYYGLETLMGLASQGHEGAIANLKAARAMLASLPPGVTWHGRVDQVTLAREMRCASAWAYPTDFPEVFAISAARAEAAGLSVVATTAGSLPEVVLFPDELVRLDRGRWTDAVAEAFLARLIDALASPPADAERAALTTGARRWSWATVLTRILTP